MNLAIRLDAVSGIAGDMLAAAMGRLPDLQARVLADAGRAAAPEPARRLYARHERWPALPALRAFGSRRRPPHHHAHAGFRDMVARIEAAPLSPRTAAHATAILRHLAEAEAAIHHVPVDEVHFHEIGDWDSLMDVTAAGSVAAALEGARWSVSALPRGDGLVRTRHGLLPVPAPATAWLMEGFTWRDDGIGDMHHADEVQAARRRRSPGGLGRCRHTRNSGSAQHPRPFRH
jgi:uncharacterized protein (DUF111 family)